MIEQGRGARGRSWEASVRHVKNYWNTRYKESEFCNSPAAMLRTKHVSMSTSKTRIPSIVRHVMLHSGWTLQEVEVF